MILTNDPDGDRVGVGVKNKNGDYILINGNQGATLLMEYIFSNMKKRHLLNDKSVMYTTVVSSQFGPKVAKDYGVKVEEFLTGFKFIGERIHYYGTIKNGLNFVFGYEESYGCLIKPFVRDKDGLQAILMYSEMALYYHKNNKDLLEVYDDLQEKYGYHCDITLSKEFVGSSGQIQMQKIMESLHDTPLKELDGVKVIKIEDYQKQKRFVNDKIETINLPKSDLVKLYFENGSIISTRPSGTEPKCKFYFSTVEKSQKLAQTKNDELQKAFFAKYQLIYKAI